MKKMMEQSKVVLDALNQQRKGGLIKLEQRVSDLMDKSITADNLDNPSLVDTLRGVIQAVNSALLVMNSHDKLIDALMNEVVRLFSLSEESASGAMQASFASEVVGSLLLEKGVFTAEELEKHQKVVKARIEAMRKQHQEMLAKQQAGEEPPKIEV
jgi:hypothetical protein